MSAVSRLGRSIGPGPSLRSLLAVLMVAAAAGSVHAESLGSGGSSLELERTPGSTQHDGKPSMDELREHASTITEILELASARVERLALDDTGKPALVEAIRQELSLTRRWNSHLSAILLDVAEARRALGERERQAAKEVTRMTAVAEEARRELDALKEVLIRPSGDSATRNPEEHSQRQERRALAGLADPVLTDATIGVDVGSDGDLQALRTTLASVQDAQNSAKRDVDAVRTQIINILQTLAARHGYTPTISGSDGLTSEDITAWAASMAARLSQDLPVQAD